MEKTWAIVAGGCFSPLREIEKCGYIVACDKGYAYLRQEGVRPDLLVGDFDSYTGPLPEDVPRLDLPVEKDDTDTMAAIRQAVSNGCERIYLYCAMGGRLDHLLGNLQAAAYAARHGVRVRLVDEENEMLIFTGGHASVPEREGYSLSVLALSDRCTGVSIHGTKYELDNVTVENSFPIGVSNQWRGSAEITVEQGVLAVIESKM
mgnify:CR=1 FL=1